MNPQQPNITSLVPLGPQGQLLDPVSFILFFLFLPIRIITEFINAQGAMTGQSVALLPRVPFPIMQPLNPTIIEAPSYTIRSAETPSASSPPPAPATYENEERCEIVWNEDGLPKEIIIHRRATRT